MEPIVSMISHTLNPTITLWKIWRASKGEPIEIPHNTMPPQDEEIKEEMQNTISMLISTDVPIIESITMTFLIEKIPIAWREQAVRHRIGARFDDKVGVDIIPELDSSMWWSQSMRIMDMRHFASDKNYVLPDSIKNNVSASMDYKNLMYYIEKAYARLVNMGVPLEDARNIIPLGTTHDITWSMNLKSFRHIVGKRSCWILQAGLWIPVIKGMIQSVRLNMGEIFAESVLPKCFQKGEFTTCIYSKENQRRIERKDVLPACPLWYGENYIISHPEDVANEVYATTKKKSKDSINESYFIDDYLRRLNLYVSIWNRNPINGESL